MWGGFDSMRVLTRRFNDRPEEGSRPMSASASGFVPGSGAGALLLESLDSALARGAEIHAEIVGGFTNSGGQRAGGSMTAPNLAGIERCITGALVQAGIEPSEIDLISGHLTATAGDPGEISAWVRALGRSGENFPWINSLKSMVGHCLSGAGAIESVAAILQLKHQFVHPSLNCEDLHPDIAVHIDPERIPQTERSVDGIQYVAKASFGFGDVNSVIILRKFDGKNG
jgi:3-oxoacyl-(acyl-carrier-protein) synthase